jgi:hypothetical protein
MKCFDRINELHQQGRTIIFITHDLATVERLCNRVLLLRRGQVIASGSAKDVVRQYQEGNSSYRPSEEHEVAQGVLSREAEFSSVSFLDVDGRPAAAFRTGAPLKVRASYVTHKPVPDAIIEVFIYSMIDGNYGPWCQLTTASYDGEGMPLDVGPGAVEFEVDALGVMPGIYNVSATITHKDQPIGTSIDWQNQCLAIRVDPGQVIRGTFFTPHRWHSVAPDSAPRPGA